MYDLLIVSSIALLIIVCVQVWNNRRAKRLEGYYKQQLEQAKRDVGKVSEKSKGASRNVIRAAVLEELAPLISPEMTKYNLSDVRHFGMPVDYIIYDGMSEVRDEESNREIDIIFLDIKSGNAKLSPVQERIKQSIERGRVKFKTIRM